MEKWWQQESSNMWQKTWKFSDKSVFGKKAHGKIIKKSKIFLATWVFLTTPFSAKVAYIWGITGEYYELFQKLFTGKTWRYDFWRNFSEQKGNLAMAQSSAGISTAFIWRIYGGDGRLGVGPASMIFFLHIWNVQWVNILSRLALNRV